MKIEKTPERIRTFISCLWIVPAVLISYLLQNRGELFFLEVLYIGALFSGSTLESREDAFRQISAIIPIIVNSYYFAQCFNIHFSVPSISTIFLIVLFFIPGLLTFLILFSTFLGPLAMIPVLLVSSILTFISDLFYTLFKRLNRISRLLSFVVSVFLIVGCASAFSFAQPYIVPLPAIAKTSDNTSADETEIVYISTYGECYHSNPRCSGMEYARAVTLTKAKESGRRACSKCYRKKH